MKQDLFTKIIEVNNLIDIEKSIKEIINSNDDYFKININKLEPIVFRFRGKRFDEEFIPIKVTEIPIIYKKSFIKYYSKMIDKKIDDEYLFFSYKRGSFEIDFQQILTEIINKGISNMSGLEITLTILFGIGAWFAKESYSEYLEKEKAKFTNETAIKAIEALQKNIELQNAKNKPINKSPDILEDNEFLEYGNIKDKQLYTREDLVRFELSEDETIKYETIKADFLIKELKDKNGKKIVTLKKDRDAKFEAISKLDDNTSLYFAFDNQQKINLKVKIAKNSKNEIIEADIYEIN